MRMTRRKITRRAFIAQSSLLAASAAALPNGQVRASSVRPAMKLGLVTYLWGQDWDLPTLIDRCQRTGITGVELRTRHRHGVEPSLSAEQRLNVRRQFENSTTTLVGYGSNAQFHENDPAKVRENIELTKSYIKLMHDCGGSGVKVKPNGLVKGVPPEQTIEQIGKSLNEIAAFGAEYGQKIRLEVHGRETQRLPNIRAIMNVADHPNVGVCWNCNDQDLEGDGLVANFNLVKNRFGDTVHVRELNVGNYPYAQLIKLFVEMRYDGWILLECRTKPVDRVAALKKQRAVFQEMVADAQTP